MGFNTETISYPSSNGQDTIMAKLFWPADCDIRAIVQVAHGMCEYIDRYADFAKFLCEHGILLCGNDHLGHRYSVSSPDDLGFFAPKDGWKYLIQDVYLLTGLVRERYPATPYYLLGHSMGSFIARCYLGKFGSALDGAIISATGGPNAMASAGEHMANLLCKTKGGHARSKSLEKLVFGRFNDRFEHRTEKDWLSRDRAEVDAYLADPYCGSHFTNAGFRDLFTLVGLSNNSEWAASLPKQVPLLLVSGDHDPLGDYGRGVCRVAQMVREAGVEDVTLKLYKGGRHEMLHETNREQVYEDLLAWLEQRL